MWMEIPKTVLDKLQYLTTLMIKIFFLISSWNFPCSKLCLLNSFIYIFIFFLLLCTSEKSLAQLCIFWSGSWRQHYRSQLNVLYSSLNKINSLNCFSCVMWSSLWRAWWALAGSAPVCLCLSCTGSPELDPALQMCLPSAQKRGITTSLELLATLLDNTVKDIVGLLFC